jgi:endogenous inhibitor of DNA gyrase (YacG/DUF329 family)
MDKHLLIQDGENHFTCPVCGHAVIVDSWQPYRMRVLNPGDIDVVHSAAIDGIGSMDIFVHERPFVADLIDDLDLGGWV